MKLFWRVNLNPLLKKALRCLIAQRTYLTWTEQSIVHTYCSVEQKSCNSRPPKMFRMTARNLANQQQKELFASYLKMVLKQSKANLWELSCSAKIVFQLNHLRFTCIFWFFLFSPWLPAIMCWLNALRTPTEVDTKSCWGAYWSLRMWCHPSFQCNFQWQ